MRRSTAAWSPAIAAFRTVSRKTVSASSRGASVCRNRKHGQQVIRQVRSGLMKAIDLFSVTIRRACARAVSAAVPSALPEADAVGPVLVADEAEGPQHRGHVPRHALQGGGTQRTSPAIQSQKGSHGHPEGRCNRDRQTQASPAGLLRVDVLVAVLDELRQQTQGRGRVEVVQ